MENIDERLTRTELAMREPAFREEYGKTNEINYWIFDYDPADELKVRVRVDNIAEKHKPGKSSMEIVKFDLYDVIIGYLRDKRPDERFLKKTYEFEERKGLEKVIDAVSHTLRIDDDGGYIIVDEIGQYIGDDSQLMLDLQTIEEELGKECLGQAWVIVTSQIEEKSQLSKGRDFCLSLITAFCTELESRSFCAGFYTSLSSLNSVVSDAVKKRFTVWVAQWSSKCSYFGAYGIWQYSSKGKVSGIGGNVDMDYSYIDFPATIKSGGFNGYGKVPRQPAQQPQPRRSPLMKLPPRSSPGNGATERTARTV